MIAQKVYQDAHRHTCILVEEDAKFANFIPMEAEQVVLKRLPAKDFHQAFHELAGYPVRRAAELYLFSETFKEVSPQAKKALEQILADPATVYDPTQHKAVKHVIATPRKESTMATAKKTAPAKKAAAPAAKKAAAPAKKAAPAKQPAAAKKAAAPEAKTRKPRETAPDTATYKVADDSSIKRGFIRQFVDTAQGLGKFTKDQLLSKMKGKDTDEHLARHFQYCRGKGVFAEA